jgi:hypothetical protein
MSSKNKFPMHPSILLTTEQRLERKVLIEKILHETGEDLRRNGLTPTGAAKGLMMIEMFRSRLYVKNILYRLSLDEIKALSIDDVASMWLEAMNGLKRARKNNPTLQIPELPRPMGRPRKSGNIQP